ncbi:hypothetical protein [Alicyclobacillus sp. ALC3]|uniref:hypothetical protein n=1 Tax=Alicyclobacillus sp. ALC3 TaxID=2796143 RepID=UPI002378A4DF|nr:hypothetical protein [Alicyclobacillus sp. ALC3]WDL96982.1 hypothetical protein JC200_22345 [Alicyclobacillus sp. ALC3]
MPEFNFSKPVVNGWHWRTLALTVAAIAVLQVILNLVTRYSVATTAPLGVLFVGYLVIPKIKERRLGNALVGVTAIFVIDLILQVLLDTHGKNAVSQAVFVEENGMSLLLGAFVCFGYTRMTDWSDRKREEREARRRAQTSPAQAEVHPTRRHHSKKKRRK